MPRTRTAHQPALSATTAAVRASPVFSPAPPRMSTGADAVRAACPSPGGTLLPTSHPRLRLCDHQFEHTVTH
jgi:hypothetical protein